MRILYFDCFAGAAGDMILGALLDAGLPFDELKRALGSLAVDGWDVSVDRVLKTGVTATKFRVHPLALAQHSMASFSEVPPKRPSAAKADEPTHTGSGLRAPGSDHQHGHHHHHHSLKQIEAAIGRSALPDTGKARAIAMFGRLAEVEADIHGMPIDQVHLHEVGAIDSIIDIVGSVFAMEWFAADRVVVSPLNVGGGMVRSAHGVFPVPAPATVRLLGQAPVYSSGIQAELLTPTGALILTEYASAFGPVPAMTVERVGYGAGDRDLPETPNVVRVLVGTGGDTPKGVSPQAMRVVTLECEIDDMNPQIFGVLMDLLYAAGALEVFYSAVQMKKNRPGTLMTIVARPEDRETLTDLVFRESTTIGIRYQELARECLEREIVIVPTPIGPVRFKVASRGGRVLNAQPEFDDLTKLSTERGIPVKDVQALAQKAWLER
ncbi:MAG: TIGR00299 family protein [Acidobacteria bacterium RIFCSPLOWO2_12_FULL_67_14b]|nr:MAG: TIGR00299 family protein [Acidobacteria bacterium RIFCSPLOWO2_12_FULL_67_14b]